MRSRSFWFVSLAAVLCVCLSSPLRLAYADSGTDGLKRLFTDPETRARMDAARKGDPVQENIGEDQPDRKIRIDGVVIREHGDNVVWINGESSLNGNKADGAKAFTPRIDRKNYRVPVKIDDKTVRMKPGQVWRGENGKVSDDY
jgi:hypothetical protein